MGNIEDLYVLSPIQSGMLFHSLYAPGSGVYVIQVSCALRGELNVKAFERAWQQVLQRHAILRSSFVWEALDRPVQAVHRHVELPLGQHDWRALTPSAQQEALADWLREDRTRGFALDEAPLMRLALAREADQAYRVIWSYHHLLLDGWSMQILLKEVFTLYEAYSRGETLHLAPIRQYRDYIGWLQQSLSAAETYWRKTLKGFTTPTIISKRRERNAGAEPAQESYSEQGIVLDAKLTAQLQEVCRAEQVTTSTAIQAAWALLLMRYSGEKDVVFGAVVSGRSPNLTGVERMVGPLINTLPVRMRASRNQRVKDWLREAQVQGAEMRQYEYSPLVEVQKWSEVNGGESLFESILVYENYPVEETVKEEIEGIRLSELRSMEQTNYPLTLLAMPGAELVLRIIYEQSRFDDESITQILRHLARALEEIASNPEQRIEQVSLLDHVERQQILGEWNQTKRAYPQDKRLHELFEEQAERTPEAVAVVCDEEQLSYGEVNERANRLAHYLRQKGVGPEVPVGLLLERSAGMIISVLAVLKAGGYYVPLDPSSPAERLSFMLADVGMPLVITHESLRQHIPNTGAHVLALDYAEKLLAEQPETNPEASAAPENLAYLIYTSGSTGRPKGVAVTHANVARLLQSTTEWFGFNERDVWTLFHSYAFDFSVWELWGALAYGGRLVVVSYEVSRDAERFYRLVVKQGVTVLNQTPSAFRQFLKVDEAHGAKPALHANDSLSREEGLQLRLVIFGGEALELQSLRPWVARYGDESPQLINMYGITETTVHVTYKRIRRADIEDASGSLIGSAIPDLRLYVLDSALEPVPLGVRGELYVGGAGLARGYLGRAEITADRFVPDPFGQQSGARLYRTGDQVRWSAAAELEYIGRIDNQVKVRGFRIELGEIESMLAGHPEVREAIVLARTDEGAEKRLVAYVVARDGDAPSVTELRSHLQQNLPDYMIPAAFVMLQSLPLTSSGKVDRRALPAPDGARPDLEMAFVPPGDPAEESLAAIWGEVLGLERIGIYDDFFAIGGHSLLAAQVIARIQREFGVELALRDFFTSPNIKSLAERISEAALSAADEDKIDAMLNVLENIDEEQAQSMLNSG